MSKKDYNLTQCKMKNGNMYYTAWIPSELAKVGQTNRIKIDGEWHEGWRVEEVYNFEAKVSYISERSQDYKKTRQASDI